MPCVDVAPRATPTAASPAEAWDTALSSWPRPHLLQSYGWGVVQASAGWEPVRLWVEVDDQRRLPVTALVGGGLPGLPPRIYVPKGPACAPDDRRAWRAVVRDLTALARARNAAAIVVEPPGWSEDVAAIAAALGPGWEPAPPIQPRHTAIVDLEGGLSAVLGRMRPKGRYNARLAERRAVVVGIEEDPIVASETLARLCAATAARQGIHQPDADHLLCALVALPGARVFVARVDGEAVAGALVAPFAGEAIYLYGGSVLRHRERQPSSLLHLEVMRWAIAEGCRRYDLWGIPPDDDPRHPWHGLRQFKLQLGGVPQKTCGAWRLVLRPLAWRIVEAGDAVREGVRRVRRSRWRRGGGQEGAVESPRAEASQQERDGGRDIRRTGTRQ